MSSKYPYISDKRMYAAVMNACKYIRETGYFNKAIMNNAQWYGVDEEQLKKHVVARTNAGRNVKKQEKRHFAYYICEHKTTCDADGQWHTAYYTIDRGTSVDNVNNKWSEIDFKSNVRNDYGGAYATVSLTVVHDKPYKTKHDAEIALEEMES